MSNFSIGTYLAGLAALACLPALAAGDSTAPGLVVLEYPHHDSQTTGENTFLEPEKFGEPIGHPYLITSLGRWKHGQDRNAIASGLLVVPETGTYHFRSDNFYDRNMLLIDGEVLCGYRDGPETIHSLKLEKGMVPIESVGFVNARGETEGVLVEWKPPNQREFSTIPPDALRHEARHGFIARSPHEPLPPEAEPQTGLRATSFTVVARDFVIEIYHNGRRLTPDERSMVFDHPGVTAEEVNIEVKTGDWLVFHVAHNPLRHDGSRYFALTGHHLDRERVAFISQADSRNWSICDYPSRSLEFIQFPEAGTEARPIPVRQGWEEGRKLLEPYSSHRFAGNPIWGNAPSTWIKYVAPDQPEVVMGKATALEVATRAGGQQVPGMPAGGAFRSH